MGLYWSYQCGDYVRSDQVRKSDKWRGEKQSYTLQPAYKVVQIQALSAYSVGSPGPDSCVFIGIGIGESRLYCFSGYRGGPEPFYIGGLHCIHMVWTCVAYGDDLLTIWLEECTSWMWRVEGLEVGFSLVGFMKENVSSKQDQWSWRVQTSKTKYLERK